MLIGNKILLVEDDPYISDLFVMYLKEEGFIVVTAKTGQEGLEKFKAETFDLVLLDIILPEKDGLSVLDEMQRANHKVPVVMVTNLAQDDLVKKAFDLGSVGYLLKARVNKKVFIKEVNHFINVKPPSH